MQRFPGSDVFYPSFAEEAPFRALHERIAHSGLHFSAVPFPFSPHCTLRTRAPVTDAEAAELFAVQVPGEFTLDTLSLYDLVPRTMPLTGFAVLLCLLHRATLSGR